MINIPYSAFSSAIIHAIKESVLRLGLLKKKCVEHRGKRPKDISGTLCCYSVVHPALNVGNKIQARLGD